MALNVLHSDFGLTASSWSAAMVALVCREEAVLQNARCQALSCTAAEAWYGRNEASDQPSEDITAGRVQDLSWQQFLSNPTEWWDTKWSDKTFRNRDFTHTKSEEALWLSNQCKAVWGSSQLLIDAQVYAGMSAVSVSTSVQDGFCKIAPYDSQLQVAACRKLCENGQVTEAVDALNQLVQLGYYVPNNLFYRILKRCIALKDLALGRRVHDQTVTSGYESNAFLANHLICMYASHGRLVEAMQVFSKVPYPDVHMWASIILAHARLGHPAQAIELYRQMRESAVKPDNHIFVAVLKACAIAGNLAVGKDVHAHIRASTTNIFVQTCLVDMYAKCGSLKDAQKVFDRLSHRNMVTWTAMIAGYAQQGMGQEALSLYSRMQQEDITPPDSVTFVCLLQACANVGGAALRQGKQLHEQLQKRGLQVDLVLGASLVNMYSKCGSVVDARRVFDTLSHKDVVTWNAMIAGYTQQSMAQEAFSLYSSMQQEGTTPPSPVTFVCLLQACASVAALPLGEQLHAQIQDRGLQADLAVGPSLVNMYSKCGSLEDAQQVFDSLPRREMAAWGALIAGYARHGDSEAVFDLVHRMKQDGIQPDGITLLSVLTVCSHVGLVDKGQNYFQDMSTDYGISPTIEHYTCMVDLLSRAGHLDEALAMVKAMPFQPDGTVWLTLLAGCRKWKNVEVGRQAFEFAAMLHEKDAAPAHVLMSNIYAGSQMWEEAKEMQERRLELGARKQPGQSWWTDMNGVVHSFVAGDHNHPEGEDIYARLERMIPRMKKAGYVPHLDSSLRDVADDEKEAELCGHSEKLAIAYALNRTPEGATIRIVKNLRVCQDCHTAVSYISKVEKRTIICRDAHRFHVYKEGSCSCGDYW